MTKVGNLTQKISKTYIKSAFKKVNIFDKQLPHNPEKIKPLTFDDIFLRVKWDNGQVAGKSRKAGQKFN